MKNRLSGLRVNIISSGHLALDHRLFDKEARSLASEGASVCVIAQHDFEEVIDDIQIEPIQRSKSRIERFFHPPWRCLFKGLINEADFWHIQDAELLLICPVLRMIRPKIIIFYDCHEDFPALVAYRDWIPKVLRNVAKTLTAFCEKQLVRFTDGLTTVSDYLLKDLPASHSEAIYNFPTKHFIQEVNYNLIESPSRRYDLLHVGTISAERLRFLTEIIENILYDDPNKKILIIGASSSQKAYFDTNFLQQNVKTMTHVPYDGMPGWLVQAKIGINLHPYLHEHLLGALPVKVIEYMAAGCTVVSSWLPELEKIYTAELSDGLLLLKSTSPSAYSNKIIDLLNDPVLLLRNQSTLPGIVENQLTWDQQEEKLINFYLKAKRLSRE